MTRIAFDEDMTCGRLRRLLVGAGIAPLMERPTDAEYPRPINISAEDAPRHGLTSPAVMVELSEWTSSAPAGTHDGIRDGAQNGSCRRRFRAYYRPEHVLSVL